MIPLVQSLTKNLSPCGGCGNSVVDYFIQHQGEIMTFVLQVQVEAESAGEAIQKMGSGTVISVNPRPQQQTPVARTFSSTSMTPTVQ